MTRWPVMATAALVLAASPVLSLAFTTPAAAQEDDWDNSGTDAGDGSLRDLVRGWVQDRADRRDMLMDLIQEGRDRRDEMRDRFQEGMDRRGEMMDFLRDHPMLRERLRDRLASRWSGGEDGGDLRSRLRERLAERLGGNCYFLTRSLRDADGSLLVIVRRRICRD